MYLFKNTSQKLSKQRKGLSSPIEMGTDPAGMGDVRLGETVRASAAVCLCLSLSYGSPTNAAWLSGAC